MEQSYNLPKAYDCDICKGSGTEIYFKDGELFGKSCKCVDVKQNLKRIETSGLSKQIKEYSFDNYIATEDWQKEIKDKALKFIQNPDRWFFIGGQVGCGKTHICTAMSSFLLNKYSLKYMPWKEESIYLKANINDNENYFNAINPIKNASILYIDDFFKCDKSKGVTYGDLNLAFEIIDYRYKNDLTTIISSEYTINDLIGLEESVGTRILEKSKNSFCHIRDDAKRNWRLK